MSSIFYNKLIFTLFCFCLFFASCKSTSSDEPKEVCFFGDSITYLWNTKKYFPEYITFNHGIDGAKIDKLFKQDFSECEGITTVIMIGTNNLNTAAKNDSLKSVFLEEYPQKYIKLLNQINASNYVVISILPRDHYYKENGILNSYIKVLNDSLKNTLKNQDFESTFVNAYPHFLKDSVINHDYYVDGLHLTKEGYNLLSSLVQNAL